MMGLMQHDTNTSILEMTFSQMYTCISAAEAGLMAISGGSDVISDVISGGHEAS